jgi:hypothetical protein
VAMVEFGDEFEILNETPNGASPIIPLSIGMTKIFLSILTR